MRQNIFYSLYLHNTHIRKWFSRAYCLFCISNLVKYRKKNVCNNFKKYLLQIFQPINDKMLHFDIGAYKVIKEIFPNYIVETSRFYSAQASWRKLIHTNTFIISGLIFRAGNLMHMHFYVLYDHVDRLYRNLIKTIQIQCGILILFPFFSIVLDLLYFFLFIIIHLCL